jgi:hypothetical protein
MTALLQWMRAAGLPVAALAVCMAVVAAAGILEPAQ